MHFRSGREGGQFPGCHILDFDYVLKCLAFLLLLLLLLLFTEMTEMRCHLNQRLMSLKPVYSIQHFRQYSITIQYSIV